MAALEEAADQAGARLKPLDKKGEKAALQAERQALEQQLRAGEDAAAGLSLAVSLLVQRVSAEAASAGSLCRTYTGCVVRICPPRDSRRPIDSVDSLLILLTWHAALKLGSQ